MSEVLSRIKTLYFGRDLFRELRKFFKNIINPMLHYSFLCLSAQMQKIMPLFSDSGRSKEVVKRRYLMVIWPF